MAKVNIGKCVIKKASSVNGAPAADGGSVNWVTIPTPKEGTCSLSTTEGTDIEATIEGGELIDCLGGKPSYTLEWEEWSEKGTPPTFEDNNGLVDGNFALQVLPDRDENCPGFQIDNCTIKASLLYTASDGQRTKYTAKVLKPATGNSVKRLNMTSSGG